MSHTIFQNEWEQDNGSYCDYNMYNIVYEKNWGYVQIDELILKLVHILPYIVFVSAIKLQKADSLSKLSIEKLICIRVWKEQR